MSKVLIEKCSDIKHEYYAAITLDRKIASPVLVVSAEGGMDIEELARKQPEKIVSQALNPMLGYQPYIGRRIGFKLGLNAGQVKKLSRVLQALACAYFSTDASIIEINPLAETGEGDFIALDAKVVLDNNGLILHPDLDKLRDREEEEKTELEAKQHGLSYIRMEGNIGCMINGAGLAMGTLDIISLHGMQPANFLDVGGSASSDQVKEAFRIILRDERVRAIFVNIFGGIMQCERIAEGIISAVRQTQLSVPLVVRLEGTNVDLGRKLLGESGLPIITAGGIEDGVKKLKEKLG